MGLNPILSATHGPLAQLAEHLTLNQGVTGSLPVRPTIFALVAQRTECRPPKPKVESLNLSERAMLRCHRLVAQDTGFSSPVTWVRIPLATQIFLEVWVSG